MPLIGLIDERGKFLEWDEIKKGKGTFSDPVPVLLTLYFDRKPYCDFSTTELFRDPYQLQLRQRYDYFETPDATYDAVLGTMAHAMLERVAFFYKSFKEKTMTIKIGKWSVGGKPDLWENKTIWDYKTCTVGKAYMIMKKRLSMNEYKMQLNTYRLIMLEHGYQVKNLKLKFIVKDWRRKEFVSRGCDFKKYPKGFIVKVPIIPVSKMEAILRKRVKLHARARALSDEKLHTIGECDTWTDQLRCKEYCSLSDVCWFRRNDGGK